jgi:hypothetical protein
LWNAKVCGTNVLAQVPLNIGFTRALNGNKWTAWLHLCQRLMMTQLSDEPDRFIWKLTTTGVFSVKSRPNSWASTISLKIFVEIEDPTRD